MAESRFEREDGVVLQARERVAKRFGMAFAQKASSAVCLEFGGALQLEGTKAAKLVLEMATIPIPEINLGSSKASTDTPERLENSQLSQRQTRIREMQKEFEARTKTVREELGRLDRRFQTCWLNQTILATSRMKALAEIAQEESLSIIDVPRQLQIEEADSALTLFLPRLADEHGFTGKGIVVAVIDAEVDTTHPGLEGRVVPKRVYTKEKWGKPHWHATAVGGILAGRTDDYWGIAPDCIIHNYKVQGAVPGLDSTDFEAARALADALEDGADVANCSWGAGPISDGTGREARACDSAWGLGMTIVKSAGNDSVLTTPADARGVIVVGACDVFGRLVPAYSGRGQTRDGRFLPDLVAPGGTEDEEIYSFDQNKGVGPIGIGTSFAAPFVTGTIACLLETQPLLHPDKIRDWVLAHCCSIPGVDVTVQGAGRLLVGVR
jgi:serine protease AprX